MYFGRDGNGLGFTSVIVDGAPFLESDLATFHPLASRLPVWFETGVTINGTHEVRTTCTDGLGETGEAAISLAR